MSYQSFILFYGLFYEALSDYRIMSHLDNDLVLPERIDKRAPNDHFLFSLALEYEHSLHSLKLFHPAIPAMTLGEFLIPKSPQSFQGRAFL